MSSIRGRVTDANNVALPNYGVDAAAVFSVVMPDVPDDDNRRDPGTKPTGTRTAFVGRTTTNASGEFAIPFDWKRIKEGHLGDTEVLGAGKVLVSIFEPGTDVQVFRSPPSAPGTYFSVKLSPVSPTVRFDPAQHGFRFNNQFANDFIPALDIRTNGLCGGMSYAALDYYFARQPIPSQQFRPANGTTLHSYLYDRQVASIKDNLDKWAEVGFNPGGTRDTELFNWGISAKKGERIDELSEFLDNARPCVLGMQGDGGTGNHQVIAFDYSMGHYQGDLGAHIEDFKISVCDPNFPVQALTLIPDVGRRVFRYREGGSQTWRTYFVDKRYSAHEPPSVPNAGYPVDGLVYELVLRFFTDEDDLRGGKDNADLTVNLTDGSQQTYRNMNLGSRWIENNDESAEVILQHPIREDQLDSLLISTTFGGGISGDNWSMYALDVYLLGGGLYRQITRVGSKRFTGEDKTLLVPVQSQTGFRRPSRRRGGAPHRPARVGFEE